MLQNQKQRRDLPEKTMRMILQRSGKTGEATSYIEFQRYIEGTVVVQIRNIDLGIEYYFSLGNVKHLKDAMDKFLGD